MSWKAEEEENTKSSFVTKVGPKKLANGIIKRYYSCNRSGTFTSKGDGKRRLKSQGSCKTGKLCLASMEVVVTSEGVTLTYHSSHCGHDFNLAHTWLQEKDKAHIAGTLQYYNISHVTNL